MDVLFQNATVLTLCDDRPVLKGGYVGIAGGKIAFVGIAAPQRAQSTAAASSFCPAL